MAVQTHSKLGCHDRVKKSHSEFLSHKNFQKNYAAGIRGNYHESSDWIYLQVEYPKKSLLKSSYPKKYLPKFSYPKKSRHRKFQPQKILRSSLSLEIRTTLLPPPPAHKVTWKCFQIKVAKFGGHSLKRGLQKHLLSPTQPAYVHKRYSRIPTTRTLLIPQSYIPVGGNSWAEIFSSPVQHGNFTTPFLKFSRIGF